MTKAAFRSVLEEMLSVPHGTLKDDDTRDTVRDWSSLVDVQIMTVIASELQMEEDPDLLACESVGDLLDQLDQRGAFAG
jgi:hypothetical protein